MSLGSHSDFPTTTLSLNFPTASQNFSKTLSSLKRSTLSTTNRLSSIHHDSLFVQHVADYYHLPLVANERCGSWYIHPDCKAGSAYFKSTDGHQAQWSFSTRRLNLGILEIVSKHGGCIIVDSTRRGKSMPDALSKTIPIWCAVMNRLLFHEQRQDVGLHTPETVVAPSEHSQIQARLDGYLSAAQSLDLDLSTLRQHLIVPLRPFFLTPDSPFPDLPADTSYHPIVCLTASRRVDGAENSEDNYIQGAGDDSEGWSHGLTPQLFWQHKESLMAATEEELPSLIQSLTINDRLNEPFQSTSSTLISPTASIFIGPLSSIPSTPWDAMIICNTTNPLPTPSIVSTSQTPHPRVLHLPTPQGKPGSRALRSLLPLLHPFLHPLLRRRPSEPSTEPPKILFTCPTGTDISVGPTLVALCLFFDGRGRILADTAEEMDKPLIRRRLAWITTAKPDARPSRETLQAVNTCLMRGRGAVMSGCVFGS